MRGPVWQLPLTRLELRRARPRILRDSRGALSLPLALMLLASAVGAFGTLGLMRRWKNLAETQLRLDRCVGDAALELRGALKRIETENLAIRSLRIAQAAADIEAPGTLVPEITALAVAQDAEIARWRLRQAAWMAMGGCDHKGDLPLPLPSMRWDERLPADMDGPQALTWTDPDKNFSIQLSHLPRIAAARVKASEGVLGATNWKASWAVPGVFGARSVRTNVN